VREVLPDDQWPRFVKMAGLLGSDHAGERAAAAERCTALLRRHGMTWEEVLRTREVVVEVEVNRPPHLRRWSWRTYVKAASANAHLLSSWEREFVASLQERDREPTDKQWRILEKACAWLHYNGVDL
jgi:hypothetical protein